MDECSQKRYVGKLGSSNNVLVLNICLTIISTRLTLQFLMSVVHPKHNVLISLGEGGGHKGSAKMSKYLHTNQIC